MLMKKNFRLGEVRSKIEHIKFVRSPNHKIDRNLRMRKNDQRK